MRVPDITPFIAAGVLRRGKHGELEHGPWVRDALCPQTDPELFYPEKGGSIAEAVGLCRSCPVKDWCLAYAVAVDDRHGVWGGMTPKQRNKLKTLQIPGTSVTVKLGARLPGRQDLLRQVARKTAAGMTAKEIAEELGTTVRNVQRIRARIDQDAA